MAHPCQQLKLNCYVGLKLCGLESIDRDLVVVVISYFSETPECPYCGHYPYLFFDVQLYVEMEGVHFEPSKWVWMMTIRAFCQ